METELTKEILVKEAAKASSQAIQRSFDAGHSITVKDGKKIVRLYPDGRKEVVSELDFAYKVVDKLSYRLS